MTDERQDDVDRELDDPVFEELFAAMRATARRPAPPMSPALTMLLAPGATGRRRRARGATVGLAVVGVLAGGVGAAAATGHLQRPAPVTRVADTDDPSGATAPAAPTPTEAVPSPPTDLGPDAESDSTAADDPSTDVVADDDATPPATRRPRATDDDDTPGTGATGSDDAGEHGDEADDGDEADGGDDSGVEEPGDDEHPDDGDEVDDGSGEDDGHSEVGDSGSEGGDGAG